MLEFRFAELRAEGRVLSGVAVRYGDVARIPGIGPETFRAGSMVFSDVVLNRQHDRRLALARTGGGGLTVTDSPEALQVRAELPPTRESDDTLTLVRRGVLRGLSTEFKALEEHRENGVRVITRASLSGVAVVDRPAYHDSTVQARVRFGGFGGRSAGFRATVPYKRKLGCECQRGDCNEVHLDEGVFGDTIKQVYEEGVRDILAVHGNYRGAIASAKRGTLALEETSDGLKVEIAREALETTAGKELVQQMENVPVYARPIIDADDAAFVMKDGVAHYSRARLKGVLIGPTDRSDGWPEATLGGKVERMEVEPYDMNTSQAPSAPLDDSRYAVWL